MSIEPGESERENLLRLLEMARQEDFGGGDVTSSMLPAELTAAGRFVAREALVFCGGVFLEDIAAGYDKNLQSTVCVEEGRRVQAGDVLAEWSGPARAMMSAERVALNFLQRLSGVATITAQYVDAAAGTGAGIYDTRKTIPGWRELEKYAVRAGGGKNHRRGLYDAVLVKDNHLAVLAKGRDKDAFAALGRQLERVRPTLAPGAFVEVEVDTLEQLEAALALPVDIIMLDNMSPDEMRRAVAMRDGAGARGRIDLEASGGVTLDNVRAVAAAGVERIAVGAITHSAGAVDIAMDIEIAD